MSLAIVMRPIALDETTGHGAISAQCQEDTPTVYINDKSITTSAWATHIVFSVINYFR